eukprot:scaffold27882_cov74-Skeletonema_dohrnii-CCMP3373.AAC.1
MAMGPLQPFSPHPPADLPLSSGRAQRIHNTFTNTNNNEGGGGGGTTSTSSQRNAWDRKFNEL